MEETPMKVSLTDPGVAGDHVVAEHNPDGSLLPAPDTSIAGIGKRIGGRPMSPEEFNHHFGHLPRDDEG
jgi:hypothetical protein